jgi:hypothetical protein
MLDLNPLLSKSRQFFHGTVDGLLVLILQQQGHGSHGAGVPAVDLFVETRGGLAHPLALEPGVTGIAYDRQQPSCPDEMAV